MQVQHIGNVNENLDHAMSLLKKLFDDKSVFLQYIIQKTFIVDQMVDKTSSLYSGLASIENNWDQINKIKMDPNEFALQLYIAVVALKLSPYAAKKWDDFLIKNKDPNSERGSKPITFDNFTNCIHLALSNCQTGNANFDPNDKNERAGRRERAQAKQEQKDNLPHSFGTKAGDNPCYICRTKKTNHYSVKCPNVKKLERDDLMNIVKKDKLCSQCFIHGHLNKNKTCYFFTKKC